MKKFFLLIFSAVFVCSQIGCGGNTPASNSSNLNSPTTTPQVETNQNANIANAANTNVKQDIPVPTFTDANTAFAEGNKYFDANETEKSIEAFKQAVKLNPDLAEAYFKLGVSYALLEKETAQTTIPGENSEPAKPTKKGSKATKTKAKTAPLLTTDSAKAFDQAVKAYKKIVAKNPKDDLAQYNLGRAYSKLNQDEESEKALLLAVKLKPDDSEYQRELGATLNKLAKYEEAIKALKKAASLDPDNSQIEDLLGKAEAGKKRIDFGKSKNGDENQDDQSDSRVTSTGKNKGNSSTPPKDKREPPRKVEDNEVKIKPLNQPKEKP